MKFSNLYNNTKPLILHLNGKKRRKYLRNSNFSNTIIDSSTIYKPDDVTIITCATKDPDCYSISPLVKQLKRNSIDFVNIGEYHDNIKQPWHNTLKLEYLHQYLTANNLKTKYVCFLDASDIFLSEDFDKIVENFLLLNVNLLWGSQLTNYPEGKQIGFSTCIDNFETDKKSDINNFLCSGVCFGLSTTFKEYIDITFSNLDYTKNIWKSDQYEIKKTFRKYYKKLNVDYDSKSIISFSPPGAFENGKLIYSIYNNNLEIYKPKNRI